MRQDTKSSQNPVLKENLKSWWIGSSGRPSLGSMKPSFKTQYHQNKKKIENKIQL
jgi:hypothetical protein